MLSWLKVIVGSAIGALLVVLLVGAMGVASAQPPTPQGKQPTPAPTPGGPNFHEEMDKWMDRMMGPGFSEKMHEAMPGSEEMLEACGSMMEALGEEGASGMMGSSGMGGIMGSGMMGGRGVWR